ncbi:gamma carbonic anhydrase family protein [Helicobacter sp. 12S02232-10]|uniref:gamma carbonic anhydrase family protein n=1 Tax=Helicobacter sp. 12S02232-10 TaxID=1476197 RepID=UPI000BA5603E|nr:gamma carbonic anhydrase family protein [Helicobacter sp. 12S02232-10]PAF47668.1 gamma carbonic anhydrase family protein [Helicobacter sp. 12S02232-10]
MEANIIKFNGVSPKIDPSVKLFAGAHIIGDVIIKEDCSIWFGCVLRGDVNSIEIRSRTNIQDLSVIHVGYKNQNGGGRVIIGEDVTIGHNCVIHACTIADLCLIGMGSIIMDDVKIGEMSIVGAGSLITKGKVFPARSLIIGNPAKFVRELREDEIEGIRISASEYTELAKSY